MKEAIVAIAISSEDDLLPTLTKWGERFDWTRVATVHFIHIVKKVVMPIEFAVTENPSMEMFLDMRPVLLKHLEEQQAKIVPGDFKGSCLYHVDCDFDPEEAMVDKLKQLRVSLVVVATHGRKGFNGLFHSSFAHHMIKFAPCDVYVVRPEKK